METLSINEIGYLEEIRRSINVDQYDTSADYEIVNMRAFDRVKLLCGWYLGDPYWATRFKDICASQGLYLTSNPLADGVIE